jgi:hypothetical protein
MTKSDSFIILGLIGATLTIAVYIMIMDKPSQQQCTIYTKQIESQNLEAKANLVDWIIRNCDEVKVNRISTDRIPKMIGPI